MPNNQHPQSFYCQTAPNFLHTSFIRVLRVIRIYSYEKPLPTEAAEASTCLHSSFLFLVY